MNKVTKIIIAAFMFVAAYLSTQYAILVILPVLFIKQAEELKPTAYAVMVTVVVWALIEIVKNILLGPNPAYPSSDFVGYVLPDIIKPLLFGTMFTLSLFFKKGETEKVEKK